MKARYYIPCPRDEVHRVVAWTVGDSSVREELFRCADRALDCEARDLVATPGRAGRSATRWIVGVAASTVCQVHLVVRRLRVEVETWC